MSCCCLVDRPTWLKSWSNFIDQLGLRSSSCSPYGVEVVTMVVVVVVVVEFITVSVASSLLLSSLLSSILLSLWSFSLLLMSSLSLSTWIWRRWINNFFEIVSKIYENLGLDCLNLSFKLSNLSINNSNLFSLLSSFSINALDTLLVILLSCDVGT